MNNDDKFNSDCIESGVHYQWEHAINTILSVYSPFSNRVGLPHHNILSPFIPVMDIFAVDLKFFPVFGLQLYTPYISVVVSPTLPPKNGGGV